MRFDAWLVVIRKLGQYLGIIAFLRPSAPRFNAESRHNSLIITVHGDCLILYQRVSGPQLVRQLVYIFIFCPKSFFSNQIQIDKFEKKSVGQNMNI